MMIYVMDSSAMIAFLRNETGAANVTAILADAQNEYRAEVFALAKAIATVSPP